MVLTLGDGGVGLGVVHTSIAAVMGAGLPAAFINGLPWVAPFTVRISALFPVTFDEAEVEAAAVVVVNVEGTARMPEMNIFLTGLTVANDHQSQHQGELHKVQQ